MARDGEGGWSIYARTDCSTSFSVVWVFCGSVTLIFAGVSETDCWAGGKEDILGPWALGKEKEPWEVGVGVGQDSAVVRSRMSVISFTADNATQCRRHRS